MAAGDLCTLADVKTWLGITDGSLDSLLGRLISAASADFLNEIRRPGLTPAADYTEHFFRRTDLGEHSRGGHGYIYPFEFYGRPAQELFLRNYPVNSVASVTVDGSAIDEIDDPATDTGFWFDETRAPEDRQKLFLVGMYGTCYGIAPNIVVAYNGGYGTVPAAISQAVIEWVAFARGQSQLQQLNQGGGARKMGNYEETGSVIDMTLAALKTGIPENVQRVIDQYASVSL